MRRTAVSDDSETSSRGRLTDGGHIAKTDASATHVEVEERWMVRRGRQTLLGHSTKITRYTLSLVNH